MHPQTKLRSERRKKKVLIIAVVAGTVLLIAAAVLLGTSIFRTSRRSEMHSLISQAWNQAALQEQEENPAFLQAFDERATFAVEDVKNEGDGYTVVTVTVTSPDISGAFESAQDALGGRTPTTDEMDEILTELVRDADLKTTQQTVSVIEDSAGGRHVWFNEAFADAMYGYAYSDAMETFMREQAQAMTEGEG